MTYITVGDVYKVMDAWAPFDTQIREEDNAGLLTGDFQASVSKIGVCLDITIDTVCQAKAAGCDLIVSHHPVIFHPLKKVLLDTPVYALISAGITAICAHTNLDAAERGVSDTLAEILGLSEISPLHDPDYPELPPMGRIGLLPCDMTAEELAGYTKDKLQCEWVQYTTSAKTIRKAAVCGGSGGAMLAPAMDAGADAFITGEIRYHKCLEAAQKDFCLVLAGHYTTEQPIKAKIAERLSAAFSGTPVTVLEEAEPCRVV